MSHEPYIILHSLIRVKEKRGWQLPGDPAREKCRFSYRGRQSDGFVFTSYTQVFSPQEAQAEVDKGNALIKPTPMRAAWDMAESFFNSVVRTPFRNDRKQKSTLPAPLQG